MNEMHRMRNGDAAGRAIPSRRIGGETRKRAPRLALALAALALLLTVAGPNSVQGQGAAIDTAHDTDAAGLTVTMSVDDSVVWQRGGKTTLRFTLSRPLEAGESVTLPLTVSGGRIDKHWNLSHHAGTAVKRTRFGKRSELVIEAGGQEATLRFVGRKGDRRDRDITIAFGKGKRAPRATGIDGALEIQGSQVTITVARNKPAKSALAQASPEPAQAQAPPEPTTAQLPPELIPQLTIDSEWIGVLEGKNAPFVIKASPAPASPITVNVQVTEDGDFGASGASTVVVTEAETAYLVSTADDDTNEEYGHVRATIMPGDGYTVGLPSSAAVGVKDNDIPPPFFVSIAPAADTVEEGDSAVFTLTAVPAPIADIRVTVEVKPMAGTDFGIERGRRTVTIPTSGRATLTVATTDDNVDERDSAVFATIVPGADYTVGSPRFGVVSISDNDTDTFRVQLHKGMWGYSIVEGMDAVYTIEVMPAPTGPLTINVQVTEDGDFGASGASTVIVTQAETTYRVSTADDEVVEPDGSVTARIMPGTGYVPDWPSAVTIDVTDND